MQCLVIWRYGCIVTGNLVNGFSMVMYFFTSSCVLTNWLVYLTVFILAMADREWNSELYLKSSHLLQRYSRSAVWSVV